MLSPVRHQSEGGLNIGRHNDFADLKSKANLSKTQGYPTSHSLIQSAFRFENFDAPVGPYNPDTAASRFRTESFATLPSRSDSITEEGQELAPHDKVVVKDGFIYKKNTTGERASTVNRSCIFTLLQWSSPYIHLFPLYLPFSTPPPHLAPSICLSLPLYFSPLYPFLCPTLSASY
jgi:hypothetical protein